ncbi:MAG: scaffold protein [Podoviridae sp. cty5g4]|nr:MAG: scaffold protein [Podoviridae sp. cty5g4]
MEKNEFVAEEVSIPAVINFADDAENPSATTVAPLPDKVDRLKKQDKEDVEVEDEDVDSGIEEIDGDSEDAIEDTNNLEGKKGEGKNKKKDAVSQRVEVITAKAQSAQERINEATRARRQKERELDLEIKRNQELQREIEKLKTAKPVAAKPKQEDFETEADFIEALTDWKLDIRQASANETQATQSADVFKKQEEDRIATKVMALIEKGNKKYKDFDDVVKDSDVPISTDMVKVISESDIGADILYYLGTHLDRAEEISAMNMVNVARAIGRIEAELSVPVKKAITKTPLPINPVQTTHSHEMPLEALSYEEYKQRRKSQPQKK